MRIALILPCCIGDVILATATLRALRRAYPNAHITWAVGSWSRPAVEHHPDLNAVLDTGSAALPVKSASGFLQFVRQLRAGKFDLAVSLVRSPLMSLAVRLSGIPRRAGLDSNGRGFGYNIRARIDPAEPRHEAEIYLDVPRALGIDTSGCYANIPVSDADRAVVREYLEKRGAQGSYLVINPAGGRNPGMTLDAKRYPPHQLAALADRLADRYNLRVVLVGASTDSELINATREPLQTPSIAFAGDLTFGQIAALAAESFLYIGNDTGLTHLAAAAGARTVMIMGPTDPVRYAPFAPRSTALWKPAPISATGVAGGIAANWDWSRDGISVDEAETRIVAFMDTISSP
jgi:ADP-heptose:LPS heptosyltransferase